MASEALEKLQEQLNCSICLDTYTDPKILQCHHVYCQNCLVGLVARNQQGQLICPNCRQATPVPAGGVAGLQSAFHINHLLEIRDSVKSITESSVAVSENSGNNTATGSSPPAIKHCPEHDEELKLYCETCGKGICYKCAIRGGEHQNHEYDDLTKAFEKHKDEIKSSLGLMEKQLMTVNEALARLDTRCGEISDQREAIEVDIDHTFRQLHTLLDARKTELINRLHQITQRKLKSLAVQKDQIETTQAQLSSCLDFVKQSLERGTEAEVIMVNASVVEQVKQLTTAFQPDLLEPNTEADTIYSASTADVTTACQSCGCLTSSHQPDPSKCHATGHGLTVATVGEESTAIVEVKTYDDKSYKEPVDSSSYELVSEITGSRISGRLERRGLSHYRVGYRPIIKGRHQLHIKVGGQQIWGSPFSVAVTSPVVERLGALITTIAANHRLWGVAINQARREVVATDFDNGRVLVFSKSNGEKLRQFGSRGSGEGQLYDPRGVAVDRDGNILVMDSENNRLQKFTAEGQLLSVYTGGDLPLLHPRSIAFNTANNKLYLVDKTRLVQVLNSDLTLHNRFGTHGSGKGQLKGPRGITCDASGRVYVADSENYRIQVFTAEGKFLRTFGRRGEGRGELRLPMGMAIDSRGMVYVCDNNNNRMSVFTSEGEFVTSFGRTGKGPGEFLNPTSVAVDECGVVYVCDFHNKRLQLF